MDGSNNINRGTIAAGVIFAVIFILAAVVVVFVSIYFARCRCKQKGKVQQNLIIIQLAMTLLVEMAWTCYNVIMHLYFRHLYRMDLY